MMPRTMKRVVRSTGLSWSHCKPSSDPLDILTLVLMYTLAGLPLGFGEVISLLLQVYGKAEDSTLFSFRVMWMLPQVLRVLWAPLVDGVYFASLGRRRSWLVLLQVSIGGLLLYICREMTLMLHLGNVWSLGAICLCLSVLAATHEMVVDGLAHDWLRAESRHCHAACSLGGQFLGKFIAGSLTTALWSNGTMVPPEAFRFGAVAFFTVAVMTLLCLGECPAKSDGSSLSSQYRGLASAARDVTVLSKVLLCGVLAELPLLSEKMYVAKMYEQHIPRHYPVYMSMAMTTLSPIMAVALAGLLAQTRASGILRFSFGARAVCCIVMQTYLVAKASPIMTVANSNMFPEHGVRLDNDENHYIHPFVRFLLLFLPIVTIDYTIFGYLVLMTLTSAFTSWLSLASKSALLVVALQTASARQLLPQLRGSTFVALLKSTALAGELISDVIGYGCLPFLRRELRLAGLRSFLEPVLPRLPESIAMYHIFVFAAVGCGLCTLGIQKRTFAALQAASVKGA
eukprot:TRINITY_DN2726_c0_g2_i1.p1 TRINITY_DN2726_c0_g2~~TRINITY_DN2726_c0_g2_i1.p1  ORF type:complete len:513 (+),score=49.80 TRINITY_DN2726_c0_g2_i1:79-1617(+)